MGANAENQQASNQVTITEAGNGYEYSQSYLQATLTAGQMTSFPNWHGSGLQLSVTVNEINTSVQPGFADVVISFGSQPAPSHKPTR